MINTIQSLRVESTGNHQILLKNIRLEVQLLLPKHFDN